MRLSARHFAISHLAATILLGLASVGASVPAHAEDDPAPVPVIGKTTLSEARAMWLSSGATVVSEGHLAIGGGNGVDGLSTVGLDQVLLVTVDGVAFESLPVARYAFVDEVLYAVSAQLHNGSSRKMAFKDLSKDEIAQLVQSLTSKYGKPRGINDFFPGKKPNIFIWDLRDQEMVLSAGGNGHYHLSVKNKALQKKVDAYTKTECKKHRQKGETRTLVTTICL
jgi:hypothetical protein